MRCKDAGKCPDVNRVDQSGPAARFEIGLSRCAVPNDNEPETRADLIAVNRELKSSLRRCVALVPECREKLAIVQNLGERTKGSRF